MPSEEFGLNAMSILITSEISLGISNITYDLPENYSRVISRVHNIYSYNSWLYQYHNIVNLDHWNQILNYAYISNLATFCTVCASVS